MVQSAPDTRPLQLSLNALDELVSSCYLSMADHQQDFRQRLRRLVSLGDIPGALSIVRGVPELEQDQRLRFKLCKQKFIEVLRHGINGGSMTAVTDALACARAELAPMALDAYPEAYTEFKQVLQLLVYMGSSSTPLASCPSDCQALLSEAARQELAEVVYQTATEVTGHEEPPLLLLMVYLLHMHSHHKDLLPRPPEPSTAEPKRASSSELVAQKCQQIVEGAPVAITRRRSREEAKRGASSEGDVLPLCERLLLPGRDAAPLRDEHTHSSGVASFRDADILALMQGAGSSSGDAIAALRHHGNQLWPALKSELQRLRVNRSLLCELLDEYCEERGLQLTSPTPDTSPDTLMQDADMQPQGVAAGPSHELHPPTQQGEGSQGWLSDAAQQGMDTGGSIEHEGDPWPVGAGQAAQPQGPGEAVKDDFSGTPQGRRGAARSHQEGDGAGGGGGGGGRGAGRRTASRSPPAKMHCSRPASESSLGRAGGQSRLSGPGILAQLKAAAEVGGVEEFHAAVQAAAPGFWEQHPQQHMGLWVAAYGARLAAGDMQGALALARGKLAPLAAAHSFLQPTLKHAMGMLIPAAAGGVPSADSSTQMGGGGSTTSTTPLLAEVVTATLDLLSCTQLGGGGQTRLVKVLQELLAVHRAWTRAEQVKDPFESDLGITSLCSIPGSSSSSLHNGDGPKAGEGSSGVAAAPAATAAREGGGGAAHRQAGSGATSDDEGWPAAGGGGAARAVPPGRGAREQDVLRLMEILAVSRTQAINLLAEYGDVEMAVNSAFG